MRFLLAGILLFYALLAQSQSNLRPANSDCAVAERINVNACYHFSTKKGYGKIQEFKASSKNDIYSFFSKEHNSQWFTFSAPFDGILTFEIVPDILIDDYDWLLFKKDDPFFCACIKSRQSLPIRGNVARNDTIMKSRTGLIDTASQDFSVMGPGNSFSSAVDVKKGEEFYLVVDDNYRKGTGFEINIKVKKVNPKKAAVKARRIVLRGKIIDKDSKEPQKAKITIEQDTTGKVAGTSFSDSLTGEYSANIFTKKYVVSVEAEGFMTKSENVNYQKLKEENEAVLNFSLDSIRIGARANFYNIRFVPNKPIIKESAEAELQRLLSFMKNYPDIFIDIKGHTNTNKLADQYFLQRLSYRRAEAVRDYLIKKGIDARRMTFRGIGGSEPLVVSDDFEKAQVNSRVEIVVTNRIPGGLQGR